MEGRKLTPAQVAAAKLLIELAEADGRQVEPRILAIANARKVQRGPNSEDVTTASTPLPRQVTPAQVAAAKLLIELAEADGRQVEPGIVAIANAKPAR